MSPTINLDISEQDVCAFKSYSFACFYLKRYLFQHTFQCFSILPILHIKNICSPYLSITFPPPILVLYITGDMWCIIHSTVLREEMVVGFIYHLPCHLQRLEWRSEAIFELMRVEKWWRIQTEPPYVISGVGMSGLPWQRLYCGPNIPTLGRCYSLWQLVVYNPWLSVWGQGFWASLPNSPSPFHVPSWHCFLCFSPLIIFSLPYYLRFYPFPWLFLPLTPTLHPTPTLSAFLPFFSLCFSILGAQRLQAWA